MTEIKEIFVLKMKNPARAEAVREVARADFTCCEGVIPWTTLKSVNPDRQTLFAEMFSFPERASADAATPQFATRDATKAFFAEVDEIVSGQFFQEQVAI